jgi:hypothetical protein
MRALDLLTTSGLPAQMGTSEDNPLVEPHALDEAMLVAISVDAIHGEAVLLFDCRNSIWPLAGHAAVKVTGLTRLSHESSKPARFATYVLGWTPAVSPGRWEVDASLLSDGRISIEAADAALIVLGTPDFEAAPPDLGDDDEETIRRGFPSWLALCDVIAVHRLPAS